jgi:hypothetical protein
VVSLAGGRCGRDAAPRYVIYTLDAWGTRRVSNTLRVPQLERCFTPFSPFFSVCFCGCNIYLDDTSCEDYCCEIVALLLLLWHLELVAKRVPVSRHVLFPALASTPEDDTTTTTSTLPHDNRLRIRQLDSCSITNTLHSSEPIFPTSTLFTMASVTRQPFGELGGSRLQLLQSAKNKQNGNCKHFRVNHVLF